MNVILGLIFHSIGGFASGSFYIPYKKVRGWNWESFWIVGGLFSWLIVPPIAAYMTIPGFQEIISNSSESVFKLTYIFGILWGIGGLTYGLGVRYLGVALGGSIILGLSMVIGSILPSIYYDITQVEGKETFSQLISNPSGQTVLLGLLVCVVGIIISGRAGVMKERELGEGKVVENPDDKANEYKFGLGIIVAIISGILSACFNFGLEAGQPMSMVANEAWKINNPGMGEFLYRNNVIYVVILWGGLTTNFIWCMLLNFRNKSFHNYTDSKTPLFKNYLFSALAGTTWFLQFFFYGMGESKLGNGASSWILHMATIIITSNLWGLYFNEWKGVSKNTLRIIILGIIIILVSVLIVGYGNSLNS